MSIDTVAVRQGGWRHSVKRRTGLDRAILFTVAGRFMQGAGSIATVLLIVRLLTPVEQGFYYTLWSLVALQVIFELGFSFVILQIAAHERAHLTFLSDGAIVGDELAQGRLAFALQWSVRWYLIMACLMGAAMMIGAMHFFALREAGSQRFWLWPLRATVFACCITFAIGPVISFLEGTGMVTDVARMRFRQSLVSTGLAWIAMLTHHGLFSPAMVLFGQGLVAGSMVFANRRMLMPLMRMQVADNTIEWRKEVWPFQWKIAVSWMCDYFIFQLFTPVLFAFRGPAEAGRMGLSMNAVTQLGGIVLTWMSTKAAPFGTLVARKERATLDALFFRTLRQALVIFGTGSVLLLTLVAGLQRFYPVFAGRIVAWPIFLLLLLTGASSQVVQSEALYLRTHKVEPFLVQSIGTAAVTVTLVFLAVRPWGTLGVTLAYFVSLGIGGLVWASLIFVRMRRRWGIA